MAPSQQWVTAPNQEDERDEEERYRKRGKNIFLNWPADTVNWVSLVWGGSGGLGPAALGCVLVNSFYK